MLQEIKTLVQTLNEQRDWELSVLTIGMWKISVHGTGMMQDN